VAESAARRYETAKQLAFLHEPFTVENDMLTPTMSASDAFVQVARPVDVWRAEIKRNLATKMLKPQADKLYKEYGSTSKTASASADKSRAKL
jgi:oligoribonuclease NrnB/cAMP/cGMP phosphodiesterase (DHH superfamily)